MKFLAFGAIVMASAAQAECLTVDDLANGIAVSHENGAVSVVQAIDGGVSVETSRAELGYGYRFEGAFGFISNAERFWSGAAPGMVGVWSETKRRIDRDGLIPVPVDGLEIDYDYRVTEETSDYSGVPQKHRFNVLASIEVSNPRTVSWGGCDYNLLTVVAHLDGDPIHSMRRWVYFPDFEFAVMTQDMTTDGIEQTNGITGMARYQGQ